MRERSGPTVFKEELRELKAETEHDCPFCQSFDELQENRLFRILHNLIVMQEMTELVHEYSVTELINIMNPKSQYKRYLEEMAAL
jgi:hypothetical protein